MCLLCQNFMCTNCVNCAKIPELEKKLIQEKKSETVIRNDAKSYAKTTHANIDPKILDGMTKKAAKTREDVKRAQWEHRQVLNKRKREEYKLRQQDLLHNHRQLITMIYGTGEFLATVHPFHTTNMEWIKKLPKNQQFYERLFCWITSMKKKHGLEWFKLLSDSESHYPDVIFNACYYAKQLDLEITSKSHYPDSDDYYAECMRWDEEKRSDERVEKCYQEQKRMEIEMKNTLSPNSFRKWCFERDEEKAAEWDRISSWF